MSEAFYGRVEAYEAGLQASGDTLLTDALARNLYRGNPPAPAVLAHMAAYMRDVAAVLAQQADEDFLAGRLNFTVPPVFD